MIPVKIHKIVTSNRGPCELELDTHMVAVPRVGELIDFPSLMEIGFDCERVASVVHEPFGKPVWICLEDADFRNASDAAEEMIAAMQQGQFIIMADGRRS